jgi:uncharacterized membrane protein YphA (DoxX/SURF4 family)
MKLLQQALGAFFVIFGITKITSIFGFGYGFAGTVGFVASLGYPFAAALVAAAILVEIVLGLLLLLPPLGENGEKLQKYAAWGLLAFTILATIMFHLIPITLAVFTAELTAILKNAIIMVALFEIGNNIS